MKAAVPQQRTGKNRTSETEGGDAMQGRDGGDWDRPAAERHPNTARLSAWEWPLCRKQTCNDPKFHEFDKTVTGFERPIWASCRAWRPLQHPCTELPGPAASKRLCRPKRAFACAELSTSACFNRMKQNSSTAGGLGRVMYSVAQAAHACKTARWLYKHGRPGRPGSRPPQPPSPPAGVIAGAGCAAEPAP